MIAPLLPLLLTAAVAGHPCALPVPAETPDPAAAEAYLSVARAEQKAGARDTAIVAYRKALALDPSQTRARDELAALCREEAGAEALKWAVQLMSRSDFEGAIAVLERVRASSPEPRAALLEGICRYRLGQPEEAAPLLEEASRDPRTADGAALYLGLVAHRGGRYREAERLFEVAAGSADPVLRRQAEGMHGLSSRQGRLTLRFSVEGGYDSDRDLQPDGAPSPAPAAGSPPAAPSGDGAGALSAALRLAPLGPSGPYLRAAGVYRSQAQQASGTDYEALEAAAGAQLLSRGRLLSAEYAYELAGFGWAPFLSAHRLLARARWPFGSLAANASYSARFQTYTSTAGLRSAYSGVRQRADGWGSWAVGDSLFALGYRLVGTSADAPNSYLEHGPTASYQWSATPRFRLFAGADYLGRTYELDPTTGVRRGDGYLDGSLALEHDLGAHWTARLDATLRWATSNVDLASRVRANVWLGLSYALGLL